MLLGELDRRTLESRLLPGLYCCGEVADVTGRLGGQFSVGLVERLCCGHCRRSGVFAALAATVEAVLPFPKMYLTF